jgi:uncharacterized membrane protein required for colicin V production
MIITDLIIVLIVAYSAYVGVRRGFILEGSELAGLIIAGCIAFAAYHPTGDWLSRSLHISLSLGNVAAFTFIFIILESLWAIGIRWLVVPRLSAKIQLSRANKIGGSAAGVLRSLTAIAFGLLVFAGLPLSAGIKQPVTGATFPRTILAIASGWQGVIAQGLGRDLSGSVSVFTIKADPESTQRIPLGFRTTAVSVD